MSSDEPQSPHGSQAEALKALGEQLSDPCLKSSTRILILISLAINGRLGFLDLLQLTGLGKGSLSNHLEKLEESRYVRTRRVMIFGGHRVVVEATQKGAEIYENYMQTMRMLTSSRDTATANKPVV